MPRIERLWIKPAAGAPMQPVDSLEIVAGEGVVNAKPAHRHVTLIAQNAPLRTILAEWASVGGSTIVNADRVVDILLGFARTSGATLLAVTHDHDLLPRFERVIDFKSFHATGAAS